MLHYPECSVHFLEIKFLNTIARFCIRDGRDNDNITACRHDQLFYF